MERGDSPTPMEISFKEFLNLAILLGERLCIRREGAMRES